MHVSNLISALSAHRCQIPFDGYTHLPLHLLFTRTYLYMLETCIWVTVATWYINLHMRNLSFLSRQEKLITQGWNSNTPWNICSFNKQIRVKVSPGQHHQKEDGTARMWHPRKCLAINLMHEPQSPFYLLAEVNTTIPCSLPEQTLNSGILVLIEHVKCCWRWLLNKRTELLRWDFQSTLKYLLFIGIKAHICLLMGWNVLYWHVFLRPAHS